MFIYKHLDAYNRHVTVVGRRLVLEMFRYGYRLTNAFKISVLSTLLWLPVDVFGFPSGSHIGTSLVRVCVPTYDIPRVCHRWDGVVLIIKCPSALITCPSALITCHSSAIYRYTRHPPTPLQVSHSKCPTILCHFG